MILNAHRSLFISQKPQRNKSESYKGSLYSVESTLVSTFFLNFLKIIFFKKIPVLCCFCSTVTTPLTIIMSAASAKNPDCKYRDGDFESSLNVNHNLSMPMTRNMRAIQEGRWLVVFPHLFSEFL